MIKEQLFALRMAQASLRLSSAQEAESVLLDQPVEPRDPKLKVIPAVAPISGTGDARSILNQAGKGRIVLLATHGWPRVLRAGSPFASEGGSGVTAKYHGCSGDNDHEEQESNEMNDGTPDAEGSDDEQLFDE
jgi:hypothetical protein